MSDPLMYHCTCANKQKQQNCPVSESQHGDVWRSGSAEVLRGGVSARFLNKTKLQRVRMRDGADPASHQSYLFTQQRLVTSVSGSASPTHLQSALTHRSLFDKVSGCGAIGGTFVDA